MFLGFSVPYQGPGIYPSFPFLSILLCRQPGQQSLQFCKLSFIIRTTTTTLMIIKIKHLITVRKPDLIIINKKENLQNCRICCPG